MWGIGTVPGIHVRSHLLAASGKWDLEKRQRQGSCCSYRGPLRPIKSRSYGRTSCTATRTRVRDNGPLDTKWVTVHAAAGVNLGL